MLLISTLTWFCLLFSSCGDNGEQPPVEPLKPILTLKVVSTGGTSATIETSTENALYVSLLYGKTGEASYSLEDILKSGTVYTDNTVELSGLSIDTGYTVFAVAGGSDNQYTEVEKINFTTGIMYPWESSRTELLSFSDLALCYGGSPDRNPPLWNADRFRPHVTYVDRDNKEHWLFDAFLLIEFYSAGREDGLEYAFAPGGNNTTKTTYTAGKEQWLELIDYWFDKTTGIVALDQAIESAVGRLGAAPFRHKILITLPDPGIYHEWSIWNSTKIYWGELDGRELDFSLAEDRIAAQKWYIDQVRRRFDESNYKNIELAGFYNIAEELSAPGNGVWGYQYKKSDEYVPAVADYLHSLNHSLTWIPFNGDTGYAQWERFNVDYAYFQPNYFWKPNLSLSQFFSELKKYNLNMELEFDYEMYDGNPGADAYRNRLREYMSGAKANGVYGEKRLAYYMGENCLYYLWKSKSEKDKEIFHEFCRFVVENPLKNK